MTRRFYAPPQAFTAHDDARVSVTLAPEETRHLRDVLRLKAGAEVYVFDGEGHEYRCGVTEIGRGRGNEARGQGDHTTLEVRGPVRPPRPESPLSLTLALALLKGEKFDLVVQKATELGAVRIVPLVTARADVRLSHGERGNDGVRRVARWQRLALEAAKQSGRARVPVICQPIPFTVALLADATGSGEDGRLLFAERGGNGFGEACGKSPDGTGRNITAITAMVGPEGGWEDEELREAGDAGWRLITLGGRTLRAETAAITVVALLQHRFGDLA